MIPQITLVVSMLILVTAIPLEANTNPRKCGNLKLRFPFEFGTTGKGSGSSIGVYWFDVAHGSASYTTPTSLLGESTGLEVQTHVYSFTKVRVNKSFVYAYDIYICYTEAGAKMFHSNNIHAAPINLTDGTLIIRTSNTNSTFLDHEPLISSTNSTLIDHEKRTGSGISCGYYFRQRGIKFVFPMAAGSVGNITLIGMCIWFTMRLSDSGTPFNSSRMLSVTAVGNISSATLRSGRSRMKTSVHHAVWADTSSSPEKEFLESPLSSTRKTLENHIGKDRGYVGHIKVLRVNFTLGLGFCCLFLVIGITGIYSSVKKLKSVKLKSEFFHKNGGLLLQQHINASTSTRECTTVFTSKDLEMTTDCHKKSRIFGAGDDGVERFINEIITLSQLNHKNVVKFLGCCLETEAPILVYELSSNGNLFDYIHRTNGKRSLPWDTLLKIASESAAALAYLHSASIIHGNVKSSNILLTDRFVAKVSGFGPPRLF